VRIGCGGWSLCGHVDTLTWMKPWNLCSSALVVVCAFGVFGETAQAAPAFSAFESGQVRPLALSPDRSRLFAVNTPDNRLEVFKVTAAGLEREASVPVGLEPIAVAVRSNSEVWVVNHVSDSVSVVDLSGPRATVKRTLLVGDEPRDIVFAGPGKSRAFITTAHRGQNAPFNPQNTTPGIGRADVWVFNAANLGTGLGGTPLTIVHLFSDVPRALAVSPNGSKVYAASFHSGNKTAVVPLHQTPNGGEAAGGIPLPNQNHAGVPEPNMSLIVKFDGQHWVDETGRNWDANIRFNLPDKDVFVIDANAGTPALVAGNAGVFKGVGTTLFNMIVNPSNGKIYVTNTEARSHVRFEGHGDFAETTVRGHLVDNRITVLDANGAHPRLLNKHIDYDDCCAEVPNDENALSVSQPIGMAITADGRTLYTAVLGNDKVVIHDTKELEADSFFPNEVDQIPVTGGGPTGLALDQAKQRLYVLTRFDNGVSIIDTDAREEIGHVTMHNPEPPAVVQGRRFLYDAALTSSHGDSSCATCHIFGDNDQLAWDLGNPDGDVTPFPNIVHAEFPFGDRNFHPMKGPMTTQSLRGMANHGPMHWRGDRNGEGQGPNVQPDGGAFSEEAAFKAFNGAFVELLGRDEPLSAADMQAFTDFALRLMYPPNPHRGLDDSLNADQEAGRQFFTTRKSLLVGPNSPVTGVGFACVDCHIIDRTANAQYGVELPGFFGSNGMVVPGEFSQTFKIAHFRNAYTKIGAFGYAHDPNFNMPHHLDYDPSHTGDQVRAFGFTHDGSNDTIMRFVNAFAGPLAPEPFTSAAQQKQVAEFIFAFDSNLRPIVGQQITLTGSNAATAGPRIDLLKARASVGDCELIAKADLVGQEVGFFYTGGSFTSGFASAPNITDTQIRQLVQQYNQPVTYTCVPPGSGFRLGVDRDADGHRDGDEMLAQSNPADPNSTP
jgi:DNA-binding beta-propeller fold protein YncE